MASEAAAASRTNPARPRKYRRWYLVAGVVLALGMAHVFLLDGLDGWFIAATLGHEDTRFSAGYSAWSFWRVGKGDSKARVLELLGEPLRQKTYGSCAGLNRLEAGDCVEVWYYSSSGTTSGDYRIRAVEFGEDGKVVRKQHFFTLD